MKKILLLSLLGISMYACSNDAAEDAPATATARKAAPEIAATGKLTANDVLDRYIKNQATLGYDATMRAFTADCKAYLNNNGTKTQGLTDTEITNLFLSNF